MSRAFCYFYFSILWTTAHSIKDHCHCYHPCHVYICWYFTCYYLNRVWSKPTIIIITSALISWIGAWIKLLSGCVLCQTVLSATFLVILTLATSLHTHQLRYFNSLLHFFYQGCQLSFPAVSLIFWHLGQPFF